MQQLQWCYCRGRQLYELAHPVSIAAMVVKIRLARFGRRNSPFYNIVVAHARYAFSLPEPLTRHSDHKC